jgi:alanyl-tRNA synthetase
MITRKELIKKYLDFFKSKGHKEIPNAPLIPQNNSTSLFIGSGMETIIPYLLGQKHPLGKRLVNIQRCIRTTDIEDVGDTYHHTFFEMLGNWSLGDYWKKEAIEMTYEFITKGLKVQKEKLAATCFNGKGKIPKDIESEQAYLSLEFPKERVAFLDEESNFWGPVGNTGPCGPNTEIFYWKLKNISAPKIFNPKNENWLEIGNNVLMTYNKDIDGKFIALKQRNIDFGGGVERTLAALNGFEDNYETEVWKPIIEKIESLSGKTYKGNEKAMRIIADHIKASVFIIADGIKPSNKEQGSILRVIIRKAVLQGKKLELKNFTDKIAEPVFKIYSDYSELKNKKEILKILVEEEGKFSDILVNSPKIFDDVIKNKKTLSGEDAFLLYQSSGIPIVVAEEIAKKKRIKIEDNFEQKFTQAKMGHATLSGSFIFGRFKSGLADSSEKTIKLHTATHLLNEALRKVLGPEIKQRGSNITPERLRFDFSFSRKLTENEIKKVEDLVNEKIKQGLEVKKNEMQLKDALKSDAQSEFGSKYPDIVSVYSIGDFSKEICTGPHVKNTREIGKFKIIKEESSAAGIRRIKAIVE